MASTLDLARRLLAIAQTGLHFTEGQFDKERYHEIARIAEALLAQDVGTSAEQVHAAWQLEAGYATPKVDVRGAVFRDATVLLVRERSDGGWTLPGGWADVNDSPAEAVEKEILQESGFSARAAKLAAVYDRNKHEHPAYLFHVWKLFFVCEITGGAPQSSLETDGVDFFALDALPPLSTPRVTAAQIQRMYEHHRDRALPTDFD
jgi:ADP-ribose pyrophosphatase YjhB (NUDIX family)